MGSSIYLLATKKKCLEIDTLKKKIKTIFDLLQLEHGEFAFCLRKKTIKYREKQTLSNILWSVPNLCV